MVNVTNNARNKVNVIINELGDNAQVIIDPIEDKVELSGLKPGETFKVDDGTEYIVLEQICNNATAVIEKKLLPNAMRFDSSDNDWKHSKIRNFLNKEYLEKVVERFGAGNIISHTVNLLSLDGLSDYGTTTDSISLLTIDQYRKYRSVLGGNKNKNWWLATPDSTPSGYGSSFVLVVTSYGDVVCVGCNRFCGVRPFCILKSSIFVSKN